MARKKSPVWDHYHQDTNLCNSTHYGARCKFCTNHELAKIKTAENDAVAMGIREVARPAQTLLEEGNVA